MKVQVRRLRSLIILLALIPAFSLATTITDAPDNVRFEHDFMPQTGAFGTGHLTGSN